MGDTWITDLTHFLDPEGQIAVGGIGGRIASHFAAIVAAVTEAPATSPRETPVHCRRRPQREPCPGLIHAGLEADTPHIFWFCPVCHDQGRIHHCRWPRRHA